MEFWNSLHAYQSGYISFRETFETLEAVLDQALSTFPATCKSESRESIADFRSLLSSESGKIRSDCASIAGSLTSSNGSPLSHCYPGLLEAMKTATSLLRLGPIDPETLVFTSQSKPKDIQATVKASRQKVQQYFSSINNAHCSIFTYIETSASATDCKALEIVKASFKKAPNPFCLVKSEEDLFPSLFSLHPPQRDCSIDPLTKKMQDCYREWCASKLKTNGQSRRLKNIWNKELLEKIEDSYRNANEIIKGIRVGDKLLQMAIHDGAKWVAGAAELVERHANKRERPIRVALVGHMSHGKSSFVNSLIGQHLVLHDAKAATVCPMIIEHDPGRKVPAKHGETIGACDHDDASEPVLYVDPEHFREYIAALKGFGASQKSTARDETRFRAHHVMWNSRLTRQEKLWLATFLKDPQLCEEYRGKEAIIKAQDDIRALIRLCSRIESCVPKPLPKPTNRTWPRLKVHMKEMELLNEPFQIVDLPGLNAASASKDGNPSTTEQNHRDVLSDVDGVILVVIALDDRAPEGVAALNFGRSGMPPGLAPLLLAVGTKMDAQTTDNWDNDSEETFSQEIFETDANTVTETLSSSRFAQASPGVYLDAQYSLRFFDSFSGEAEHGITLQKLKELDPIAHRTVTRMYNYTTVKTQVNEVDWAGVTLAKLRTSLKREVENSNYTRLREIINKYVVKAGRRRDQLLELGELRPLIDQIQASNAAALRASAGVPVVQTAMQMDSAAFDIKTRTICRKWTQSQEDGLKAEVKKIIASALYGPFDRAESQLDKLIPECFEKYAIPNSKSTLRSVDDGITFLLDVEEGLKEHLNSFQLEIVETIRDKATQVWNNSFSDLQTRINEALVDDDQDETAFSQLKGNLLSRVEDLQKATIAVQVCKQIQEELTLQSPSWPIFQTIELAKRLTHYGMSALWTTENMIAEAIGHGREPFKGDSNARQDPLGPNGAIIQRIDRKLDAYLLKRRVTGGSSHHMQNQIPALTAIPAESEIPGDVAALADNSINSVGFLIRAPALASAVDCPITLKLWPWITMPANSPVDVDPLQVKKQYKKRVLDHWMDIMTQECVNSVAGAINLIIDSGEQCINEFVSKKKTVLTEIETFSGSPFPPDTLDQLILLRINALSTGFLVQDFGQRLYKYIAKPDPRIKKRDGLPTFPDI